MGVFWGRGWLLSRTILGILGACLRFLKVRACTTDGLCMMTDAKHRVRSTRGARGSNPSQKTPRQRSARSALFCA